MNVWTWVLTGLCVAGVLLAAASLVVVAVQALRLVKRLQALQQSRLFVSAASLQLQAARLSRVQTQVEPLAERARGAVETIRGSVQASGLPEARASLDETGAELSALMRDLR